MGSYLTKSRYIIGLQCARRLWLTVREPNIYDVPAPSSRIEFGKEIGQWARMLFPGGTVIEARPWEHSLAVGQTAALMANTHIPAIFEAAFEYEDIRIS